MNCDEAFDALTDPEHRRHDELKWHWDLCPRCRQMRDVLAPALSLFEAEEERLARELGTDLPAAKSAMAGKFLTVEAVQVAKETASNLTELQRPKTKKWALTAKRFAIQTVAIAAVVAIVFSFFGTIGGPQQSAENTPSGLSPHGEVCLWKQDREKTAGIKADSRAIVKSCLACHVDRTIE